ncbi:MAG TPA: helix-turn-helix domain-containing protein, partial [Nocardioides sp.]|nr:helix-turn-helix domain-containing protein [Nocardioides sp.]
MPARSTAATSSRVRTRWAPEKRREQLLRVAERVFAEQGYQGTSVNDVAAAAGVTRTLVYKYFKDTDELYLACVLSARAELEDRFATAALAHQDPGDQLRAGVTAYYEFVQ